MTPDMLEATRRLSDALRRENEALLAFDVAGAIALLGEKTDAAARFTSALARPDGPLIDAPTTLGTAHRLRDLADENRRLLERAMEVQNRVMEIIRKAAIKPGVNQRYRRGGKPDAVSAPPMAMLADV